MQSQGPGLPKAIPSARYDFAVHQDCALDDSQSKLSKLVVDRSGTKCCSLEVATNYVTVTSKPLTLYTYSIEYGTITPVKTKKQEEDDDDEKTSGTATITSTIKSLSFAPGEYSDKTASRDTNRVKDEGRKIQQRGEKARIFEASKILPPLHGIPHATDYELLWTLKPLSVTSANDVIYKELSGRQYTLDQIDFTPKQTLQIPGEPDQASKSLLNSQDVTKKGGSLRTTALNALISKRVSGNPEIVFVGPNKFLMKAGYRNAGGMLNIHRGYFTSIRPGLQSILLNVNVATSAFFQPLTAAVMYKSITNSGYDNPEGILKGLTVRIAYSREQYDPEYDPNLEENRLRAIAGFGSTPGGEKFELNDEEISVADHFTKNLGAPVLNYKDLGCISVNVAPPKDARSKDGTKFNIRTGKGKAKSKDASKKEVQPLWIPPEYLQIYPFQPFGKLLSNQHTDEMIKVALRHPAENQNLILNEGFPLLDIGEDKATFKEFGLKVGHKLLRIPARTLPAPEIYYANGEPASLEDGSWTFKGLSFHSAGHSPPQ